MGADPYRIDTSATAEEVKLREENARLKAANDEKAQASFRTRLKAHRSKWYALAGILVVLIVAEHSIPLGLLVLLLLGATALGVWVACSWYGGYALTPWLINSALILIMVKWVIPSAGYKLSVTNHTAQIVWALALGAAMTLVGLGLCQAFGPLAHRALVRVPSWRTRGARRGVWLARHPLLLTALVGCSFMVVVWLWTFLLVWSIRVDSYWPLPIFWQTMHAITVGVFCLLVIAVAATIVAMQLNSGQYPNYLHPQRRQAIAGASVNDTYGDVVYEDTDA